MGSNLLPSVVNPLGRLDSSDWERQYLRDTLWREEQRSRQLQEQIGRLRDNFDNDKLPRDGKKDLRKKVSALSRRLRRCERSINAVNGNLAALQSRNKSLTQNVVYGRDMYGYQNSYYSALSHLHNQMQQMTMCYEQLSPSLIINTSMSSPLMLSPSEYQADCHSPSHSTFYDPSLQPFNYFGGRAFTPPPCRPFPTSTLPSPFFPWDEPAIQHSRLSISDELLSEQLPQPVSLQDRARAQSVPTILWRCSAWGDNGGVEDGELRSFGQSGHRHST